MCRAVFLFHTCGICTPSIPPQTTVGANSVRPFSFAHMVCTNSNLTTPRKWDVEGAVPYIWRYSLSAAKSLSLFADFTKYKKTQKKRCRVFTPTPLCYVLLLCYSSIAYLHRLVGLRLLRLCPFLVSEVEQEIYSAMGFAP